MSASAKETANHKQGTQFVVYPIPDALRSYIPTCSFGGAGEAEELKASYAENCRFRATRGEESRGTSAG